MDRNTSAESVTDPGQVELGAQLRSSVGRAYRRFRSERPAGGLGDGALEVLTWLHKHGPHTLTELAEQDRVSPASMSQTVNRLAVAGYVERTRDPTDGRKVLLRTTSEGAAIGSETIAQRNSWLDERLAALRPEDRRVLACASAILSAMADD
jgi:DNA-binding MarR family transcriptional regulator